MSQEATCTESPEEKVLRKCLRASLAFLTGLIGSHMFIYVFAISLRPPLSSRKNVSLQILKETKTSKVVISHAYAFSYK